MVEFGTCKQGLPPERSIIDGEGIAQHQQLSLRLCCILFCAKLIYCTILLPSKYVHLVLFLKRIEYNWSHLGPNHASAFWFPILKRTKTILCDAFNSLLVRVWERCECLLTRWVPQARFKLQTAAVRGTRRAAAAALALPSLPVAQPEGEKRNFSRALALWSSCEIRKEQ